MNREEKRRQKKRAEKAAKTSKTSHSSSFEPSASQQNLSIQQTVLLGQQHHSAGDIIKAESSYRKALQVDPNHPVALHLLGVIALQVGKSEIAVDLIGKSVAINPDYAEAHNNLGNAFKKLGMPDDAVACYQNALAIKPAFAEVHYNLANTLKELGQLDDAIASYREALSSKPAYAEAYSNLGNALQEQGKLKEATSSYRKALTIKPDFAEAHISLGVTLMEQGKLDEAVTCYSEALSINPDYAEAHSNLGIVLQEQGKLEDAVASHYRALAIKPDYAEAQSNLGNVLKQQGKLNEAAASYHEALSIKPDYAKAHNNLGVTFMEQGKLEEAVISFDNALSIKPDYEEAHSHLISAKNYLVAHSASELLSEALIYGENVAGKARPYSKHVNSSEPGRKLRVGLVSGDFRQHPVGHFLLSFLSQINEDGIELCAYTTSTFEDDLTTKIRANVFEWRQMVGVSDQQMATDIIEDEIDILVDLSGHTAKNRLSLFAWKPAPIQVTWLGYFSTTGVTAIDYILCDRWVLPPEEESHFSESPIRLPDSYLCFTPPDFAIDVNALPALKNNYITFGCFNNLTKVNGSVISCWSRVLHKVPDSRLFLKSKQLIESTAQQDILRKFAAHGITADRFILEGNSPRNELLATYNRVDICLDPYPYPGGTTSVEALWMGVPVITLQGDRFLSHVGESILQTIELNDWIAPSLDDYVEIAGEHSSNLAKLSALRNDLRQRLIASPLCNASRFARNFENAFREMWQVWCAQQSDT